MKNQTSRSGSWRPYIPQLGTPNGCRTSTQSSRAKFYIIHSAKRLGDPETKYRSYYPECSATKCSLTGAGIPSENGEEDQLLVRRSSPYEGTVGLGSGCVPNRDEKVYSTRPQQGRIHEETGDKPMLETKRCPIRIFVPPDNLSNGLVPVVDYDLESFKRNRCGGGRNASSLGPGFQPIAEDPQVVTEERVEEPISVYKRVYGIKSSSE